MTQAARDPQPERRAHAPGLGKGDSAVSPVVGMILVLAISVVGIAAILYWGLPTIDEMKANVEFKSLETQFQELDSTIKELVAGTTEKTAKRWQPSLNRGSVSVRNNTEPWLYQVETFNSTGATNHDFVFGGLSDGDHKFAILTKNGTHHVKVEAYIVLGTTTTTTLSVNIAGVPIPNQMTGSNLTYWAPGATQEFRVYRNSTGAAEEVRLENATYKFRVYSNSSLIAEAWYVATGRVEYRLDTSQGTREVIQNNGAVITGADGYYALVNAPPLPPPSETSGVHRLFARAILLGGTVSAAGTDQFDLLISLYATATLASYDCARTDRSDCVEAVKIYNFGAYQAPWYAYLTNSGQGYDYVKRTETVGSNVGSVTFIQDLEPHMGFTLLQSALRLSGGGG